MLQRLAKKLLTWGRWTVVGDVPAIDKAVFVAAFHTSNWDGFWLIVYKIAFDVRIKFLAKNALFWWPLGPFLRKLGAIPVDRDKPGAVVGRLVDEFATHEQLFLALAPEGTRKWRPYWKTGFYKIAIAADVPIVLTFLDYQNRQLGIGPTLHASGDVAQDLKFIRAFYAPKAPRYPALKGPIAFPPD